MNRRGFLKFLGAGVAGIAIDQAIPLGRVWSFPKEIVIPEPALLTVIEGSPLIYNNFLETEWVTMESLRLLKKHLTMNPYFNRDWDNACDAQLTESSDLLLA